MIIRGRARGAANGCHGGQPRGARHPRPVWGPPARATGLNTAPAARERVCAFRDGPHETPRSGLGSRGRGHISRGGLEMRMMTRREVLKGSAAAGLVVGVPAMLSAQGKEP